MKTETKNRPILFSGPMVRALLAGTKTQTRRVCKIMAPLPKPHDILNEDPDGWQLYNTKVDFGRTQACFNYLRGNYWQHMGPLCPYGAPGYRLWVKETWNTSNQWMDRKPTDIPEGVGIFCAADYNPSQLADLGPWRPCLFMRRWMSRITLEIVSVRVERLHDISEADAKAEGVEWAPWHDHPPVTIGGRVFGPAFCAYKQLWESINGPGSWQANPWVWVIEFKRV